MKTFKEVHTDRCMEWIKKAYKSLWKKLSEEDEFFFRMIYKTWFEDCIWYELMMRKLKI
jgi:hypothetical protein